MSLRATSSSGSEEGDNCSSEASSVVCGSRRVGRLDVGKLPGLQSQLAAEAMDRKFVFPVPGASAILITLARLTWGCRLTGMWRDGAHGLSRPGVRAVAKYKEAAIVPLGGFK